MDKQPAPTHTLKRFVGGKTAIKPMQAPKVWWLVIDSTTGRHVGGVFAANEAQAKATATRILPWTRFKAVMPASH